MSPFSRRAAIANAPLSGVLTDYLSRADLARELGVNERTLDRWQRLHCGPPLTHVGRQILYRKAAVREWLQSQERQPRDARAATHYSAFTEK
jgi:Helix-turn-helix domain